MKNGYYNEHGDYYSNDGGHGSNNSCPEYVSNYGTSTINYVDENNRPYYGGMSQQQKDDIDDWT